MFLNICFKEFKNIKKKLELMEIHNLIIYNEKKIQPKKKSIISPTSK